MTNIRYKQLCHLLGLGMLTALYSGLKIDMTWYIFKTDRYFMGPVTFYLLLNIVFKYQYNRSSLKDIVNKNKFKSLIITWQTWSMLSRFYAFLICKLKL